MLRAYALAPSALAVVAVVVTGCGPASTTGEARPPSPAVRTSGDPMPSELWTDTTIFEWPGSSALFAEHCPSDRAAHLGDSVEADEVEIIICATEIRPVVGDGSWRYAVVHRVTGGVDELLAAYAQPDDDTELDICTSNYVDPGHVWLHEPDGQVATVRAPTDRCHPLDRAREAFRRLTTVLVAEERLDQTSTQLSDDTGCPDDWLDVLVDPADDHSADQPANPWQLHDGHMLACTYQLTSHTDRGQLIAARRLDRVTRADVNRELIQATIDESCAADTHSTFVVLAASSGFVQHTYVALDGCAVQQNLARWRSTEALRALLD